MSPLHGSPYIRRGRWNKRNFLLDFKQDFSCWTFKNFLLGSEKFKRVSRTSLR